MIKTVKNPTVARAHRAGFTLVEVLLVLLLLSSLALVTVLFVDNADDQVRFEQTRSRLEQIRRAIVGDTSRTLNGEPVISGFVADMGRLPENLSELIEAPQGSEWKALDFDKDVLSGVTGMLYGGWRGPYLDGIQESDVAGVSGVRATLRDGWGNLSQKETEGEKDDNFGWLFQLTKKDDPGKLADLTEPEKTDNPLEAKSLLLQSLGSDGETGSGDPENTYQADYPPEGYKIALNDWAWISADASPDDVSLPITVRLIGVPSDPGPQNLKLQLYYLVKDGINPIRTIETSFSSLSGVTESLTDVGLTIPSITKSLPMGTYAAIVVCQDGFDWYVYDGNCTSASTHAPYYFKRIPRDTQTLTVNWTVQ